MAHTSKKRVQDPAAIVAAMFLTRQDCINLGIPDRTLRYWISRGLVETAKGPKQTNGKLQTLVEAKSLIDTLAAKGRRDLAQKVQDYVAERAQLRNADCGMRIEEEVEESPGHLYSSEDRLTEIEQFEEALGQFKTPEMKLAGRRRCLDLERLVLEWKALAAHHKIRTKAHPKGRPEFHAILKRAVATDPVWLERYPADREPPSLSTFETWVRAYNKEGKAGFLRERPTLDPSNDKRFKLPPPPAIDWLWANLRNYTSNKRILTVHLGKAWLKAGQREKWDLPWTDWGSTTHNSCYSWLSRWVRGNVSDAVLTAITRGQRALELMMMPIKRTYEELSPWEGFTSDWRPFDVIVNSDGRLRRLSLCPIIDLASRALAGFYIDDRPTAHGVRLAMLDAVRQSPWKHDLGVADVLCGLPQTYDPERPAFLHIDNGKEFRAYKIKGETMESVGCWVRIDDDLKTALATWNVGLTNDLQIKAKYARIRWPRGKLAEWWYTFVARWEKPLPGYCGNKPSEKPHWLPAAFRIHEALKKRQRPKAEHLKELPGTWLNYYEQKGSVFPLEEDFRAWFIEFVGEYLHRELPSLRDGFGAMSPIQYLRSRRDPGAIQIPTEKALAQMMMEYRQVTVKNGQFAVNWGTGERFVYFEPEGSAALLDLPRGARVEFRYDPNELGRGWVYWKGSYLCQVVSQPLIEVGTGSEDLKKAIKLQRQRAKAVAQQVDYYASRGESELVYVSRGRAREEKLAVAGGHGPIQPIKRITRYDQAPTPKARRGQFKVIESEQMTMDDLPEYDEPEPVENVENDFNDWADYFDSLPQPKPIEDDYDFVADFMREEIALLPKEDD